MRWDKTPVKREVESGWHKVVCQVGSGLGEFYVVGFQNKTRAYKHEGDFIQNDTLSDIIQSLNFLFHVKVVKQHLPARVSPSGSFPAFILKFRRLNNR